MGRRSYRNIEGLRDRRDLLRPLSSGYQEEGARSAGEKLQKCMRK